jgi:hypothetical protein
MRDLLFRDGLLKKQGNTENNTAISIHSDSHPHRVGLGYPVCCKPEV